MYTNAQGQIIEDQAPYIGADGTKYPWNFPKGKIKELTRVQETKQPTDKIVTGFSVVDGIQVWATREETADEINNKIKSQISALEAQQTKRREREALLSVDGVKWMEELEAKIAVLREKIKVK